MYTFCCSCKAWCSEPILISEIPCYRNDYYYYYYISTMMHHCGQLTIITSDHPLVYKKGNITCDSLLEF